MTDDEQFRKALEENVEGIGGSLAFCNLYSPEMADILADPWPAIQLGVAIMLRKPIILAIRPGVEPPIKLFEIADALIYGETPEELAEGIKKAMVSIEERKHARSD